MPKTMASTSAWAISFEGGESVGRSRSGEVDAPRSTAPPLLRAPNHPLIRWCMRKVGLLE